MARIIFHKLKVAPQEKAMGTPRTQLMEEERLKKSSKKTQPFHEAVIKPKCKCITLKNNNYLVIPNQTPLGQPEQIHKI